MRGDVRLVIECVEDERDMLADGMTCALSRSSSIDCRVEAVVDDGIDLSTKVFSVPTISESTTVLSFTALRFTIPFIFACSSSKST